MDREGCIVWDNPSEVILYHRRDPLGGKSREEIVTSLANMLRNRAVRVYLFGSFARDQLSPDSDVDIILIADTERAMLDRYLDFKDVLDLAPRVDLLVYTPAEWEQIQASSDSGFWKDVMAELIQII